jgi:ribonuclease I
MFKRKTITNTQIEEAFDEKNTGSKNEKEAQIAVDYINNFLENIFLAIKLSIFTGVILVSFFIFLIVKDVM